MVTFITGFPGSGKTYKSICKIYDIMAKNHDLSKDIDIIYTNINGIQLDKFPQNDIKLKKLNVDDFYKYLTESYMIYDLYKNSDDVDKHLVKHAKEKGYFNTFIVLDECHDFLANQDKIKVYWLTYHRHLHHEIDLITQNKSLINSKYRAIPEIFIEAQARSKKLFSNTLTYKHFASFAMRKSDLFNKTTLKSRKEVFDLYTSGNTSKQKSILKRFLIIILFAFIIVSIITFFVFNSFKSSAKKQTKKQEVKHISTVKVNHNPQNFSFDSFEDYVLKVVFDSREGYLIFNEYYSINHFRKFLKKTNSKVLSKYSLIVNKNYKLSNLYVLTNDEKLKKYFVIPKIENQKNLIDSNNIKIDF